MQIASPLDRSPATAAKTLTGLRRQLAGIGAGGSSKSQEGFSGDKVRDYARRVGIAAVENLDEVWEAPRRNGPIDVVDLFSGCGGLSAGFHAINAILPTYNVILAADLDETANLTYEANFGHRPELWDVGALAEDPAAIQDAVWARRSNPKNPLVVVGGPPCQGFSSQGGRRPDDPRNSLLIAFARVAISLNPDAIILENVPELLSDNHWPMVDEVRVAFEEAGYDVTISVHNTAEFGVPQERFRALILASKKPAEIPRGFLSRSEFATVRTAISHLPEVAAGERRGDDPLHYCASHKQSTIDTLRAVPHDGGNRPAHVGPDCLRRAHARQGKAVYEDVYGRLAWDRPAVTITNYARNPASGRYAHPEQDRGLTIREAALLQSFPESFHFVGTLDPCFRQIGNAVPPKFATFVASVLLGELLTTGRGNIGDAELGITGPIGPSFSRLIPSLKAGTRRL